MAVSGIQIDKAAVNEMIKLFDKDKKIRSISLKLNHDKNPTKVIVAGNAEDQVPSLPPGSMSESDGVLNKLNLEDFHFGYFLLKCRLSKQYGEGSPSDGGEESFHDYAVLVKWSNDDCHGQVHRSQKMTVTSTWGTVKAYFTKNYGKVACKEINDRDSFSNEELLQAIMEHNKIVGRVLSFEGKRM